MSITAHHVLCNNFLTKSAVGCEMCKELYKEFPTMNESNSIEQIQDKWPNVVVVNNAIQDIN